MKATNNTAEKKREYYPLELRELKAPLQMWAMEEDRSVAYIIRRELKNIIDKKFGYKTQKKTA
jgi:hypothetical protein